MHKLVISYRLNGRITVDAITDIVGEGVGGSQGGLKPTFVTPRAISFLALELLKVPQSVASRC